MEAQETIKLIAAISGMACLACGIVALFIDLRASGTVDVSGRVKGKVKTGSAGVMLLFFGVLLLGMVVFKGTTRSRMVSYETVSAFTPTGVAHVLPNGSGFSDVINRGFKFTEIKQLIQEPIRAAQPTMRSIISTNWEFSRTIQSPDLSNWQQLSYVPASNNFSVFADASTVPISRRFYRAAVKE